MSFNIGSFSVAVSINSFWLEAGTLSLHLTRDTFHWIPAAWSSKAQRDSSISGDWLGLHFAGSRTC
jgi:hypothetical protein